MKIVLSTLNSRYTHSSLALRYIFANMRELRKKTLILEFSINDAIQSVAEKILDEEPTIIGLGVYIWNATQTHELIEILKKVSPHIKIVLGGPEVSYEPFRVDFFSKSDFIIQGEGDIAFYNLCKAIYSNNLPKNKIIRAKAVDLSTISLPYKYYNQEDIKNRYIYVEASRGCPFTCEFCLSSIDEKVRNFNLETLLAEFELLWKRGVRNFKFIDRTFNINMKFANKLLDFFLAKEPPYFAHFEVIPDYFPDSIKRKIALFPAGALQLEIGIQTLNTQIAKNINRPLKIEKIKENINFLQTQTKAHIHLDLIVGLPGETLRSFGENLNQLYSISNAEIQIGILKKLSGTTLNRHDIEHKMVYSDIPPYDILQNSCLSFKEIQKMKRFARFWDLIYNSGNFQNSFTLLFKKAEIFDGFYAFSEWIYAQTNSTWKISLERLSKLTFTYATDILELNEQEVAREMLKDFMKVQGRIVPSFLKPFIKHNPTDHPKIDASKNKRQSRRI